MKTPGFFAYFLILKTRYQLGQGVDGLLFVLALGAQQGLFALLCWLGALGCSAVRFVRRAGERPAALICGSAVLGYCVQAFFGISMCLSTPFFVIAWAMLETREN